MAVLHKTGDGEHLPAGMVQVKAGKDGITYQMRGEERVRIAPGETALVPAAVGRGAEGRGAGRITSKPLNTLECFLPREGETAVDAENRMRRTAGVREKVDPADVDEMELWRYRAGLRKTDPRYKN